MESEQKIIDLKTLVAALNDRLSKIHDYKDPAWTPCSKPLQPGCECTLGCLQKQ